MKNLTPRVSAGVNLPASWLDKARGLVGVEKRGVPDLGVSIGLAIQMPWNKEGFDVGFLFTRRALAGAGFMLKANGSIGLERGSFLDFSGSGGSASIFMK